MFSKLQLSFQNQQTYIQIFKKSIFIRSIFYEPSNFGSLGIEELERLSYDLELSLKSKS